MRDPCFLSREKFHHLGPVGTEAALNNLGEKKAIMSEIADFRFGIKKMTHTSVHVIFFYSASAGSSAAGAGATSSTWIADCSSVAAC